MQDRYTGDVGDFGKYGLLRALTGLTTTGPRLRLGVIWYRVPDESGSDDGKHVSYLSASKSDEYRPCDPDLYGRMQEIVGSCQRTVASVEEWGVLSADTLFYSAPVPTGRAQRQRWAAAARGSMAEAQVVFVDPDNGLEGKNPTAKHALFDELAPLRDGNRTIVIYQQQGRMRGGRTVEIPWWLRQVRERLPDARRAFGLRLARGTSRVFIVVPAADQVDVLRRRARAFLAGPWGQQKHFDPVLYEAATST